MPERARWDFLKANATGVDPTIGALIDQAMLSLEAENPSLKGVLTKNYARPELDQTRLAEVVKLFSDLTFQDAHHGQGHAGAGVRIFPVPVRHAEGKRAESSTRRLGGARCWWRCLQPYKGRVFDPCCGSGGMFVQSEKVRARRMAESESTISVYGQESNPTTWRLAKMNLAIRGIEGDLGHRTTRTASTRSAPRPEGRLRPCQPAVQHERLGRGRAA